MSNGNFHCTVIGTDLAEEQSIIGMPVKMVTGLLRGRR